ncbi:MAG: DUF6361 family protein [Actinomycetota bacterium]|nr:DUF6361 family protein [Actinomycetota bacterium]
MTSVAYAPTSSAGWLDLDAAASERVGVLLRSLEEPGTLDPLGLGSVRDAFSGMLSPGTSTIQTRLRYFVFLPWIFGRLEAERVAPGDFARRLRDLEARLIDCLRHLGRNQGVIGYRAGNEVMRLPSEVYWGGLGSWGLRRYDLSLSEYGKRAAAFGRMRPDLDDDGNVTAGSTSMWARMPPAPEGFLSEPISFDVEPDEAQLLSDHIRQCHPRSLFAALCARPASTLSAAFPWDLRDTGLPGYLDDALRHAQCFSELTVGPQHLYNVLLARKARDELRWDTTSVEDAETSRLDAWTKTVMGRYDELRAWADDMPGFWAFLGPDANVPHRTQTFVEEVVRRGTQAPEAFARDSTLHAILRDREIQLKTKRARLANRSALEGWNQDPFGGQLNYRWPITRAYLSDIADGLEGAA